MSKRYLVATIALLGLLLVDRQAPPEDLTRVDHRDCG